MDIGRCVNEALDVYKKNLPQLVVAAFLFQVLGLLSLTILMGPLVGGWSLMTLNALRREDRYVDLNDLFRGFQPFFSLVGLFYLTFIPILLGIVLCVVPGVLLMTIWIFCFLLMIDRGQGVFQSLATSKEIVMRSGFGNYILLMIIVLAISLAPEAIPYAGVVVGWFLMPIAFLIETSAYLQEVDQQQASASLPPKPKA